MLHNALVLAAGGSTRLGRPKQLLMRDGETLVHRAVRLALATGPARLLVMTGGNAEVVSEAIADLPAQVVFNPEWQEGLASSLRLAAAIFEGDKAAVLILGCDQPALQQDHLQRLLAGAMASTSGCAATVHAGTVGIPVVVNSALLQDARALQGDKGLRDLLRQLPAGSLYSLQAPELQFDLDTQDDVEEAMRKGGIDRH
ncbi:MAG: nucleotidyltransferase family protein [Pseudoxanthomonas sp.]